MHAATVKEITPIDSGKVYLTISQLPSGCRQAVP
jgi:hypothetical protein